MWLLNAFEKRENLKFSCNTCEAKRATADTEESEALLKRAKAELIAYWSSILSDSC
jgi:hypothetical protein